VAQRRGCCRSNNLHRGEDDQCQAVLQFRREGIDSRSRSEPLMWTIRQEQAETFRQHHLRKFEDEMVEHLAKFAPKHWKSICEQSGRQVIRLGIAQAKKYEFKMRGPVRFYIELMFMFGSDFDTDPQCSWASAVLNAANLDEAERSDRLYYRLRDYMLEVLGMDRQHEISALRRVLQIRMEEFTSSKANLQDRPAFHLSAEIRICWSSSHSPTCKSQLQNRCPIRTNESGGSRRYRANIVHVRSPLLCRSNISLGFGYPT